MDKRQTKRILNYSLLAAGVATAVTGCVIQLGFHVGRGEGIEPFLGLLREQWAVLHKLSSVAFLGFCIRHIYAHRKWYSTVLGRSSLYQKNRHVLLFSFLFIITSITGLIPWFIDLCYGGGVVRHNWVEVHDKVALLLAVFAVLHVARRVRRLV